MSRRIGTPCETAVVNYLRKNGVPHAERRALHGSLDQGDIVGWPGVCVEVKGGHAAEKASDGQVRKWLAETDQETLNAGAYFGLLVMKRKGIGLSKAGSWWCVMTATQFVTLAWPHNDFQAHTVLDTPVRTHFSTAVVMLRAAGYGNPL